MKRNSELGTLLFRFRAFIAATRLYIYVEDMCVVIRLLNSQI